MAKTKYCKAVLEKLNSIKEDRKRQLERIEEVKLLNEDCEICEKLLPEGGHLWVGYEINVSWAVKGIDEVKELLKRFAKEGIMLDRLYEDESEPKWFLKGKKGIIKLIPSWCKNDAEGATCKLVQVGFTEYKYPKYKLVCAKDVPIGEALKSENE